MYNMPCVYWPFGGYAQGGQKKLPPKVFVPKGQWIAGSSVSYSEHTENNYDFLVVEKINSDGYSFKIERCLPMP